MSSLEEFRKQVEIPETCPFCGEKLTVENAAIDYIIPKHLGGSDDISNLRYVCSACNSRKAGKYDALLEYYLRLMKAKGKDGGDSKEKIEFLLRNTSEKDLEALGERVERMDGMFKRIMAYADAWAKIQGKTSIVEEPSSDELAESMLERLKAYSKYDYKNEQKKEINGNYFTYKKGFPIDEYTDILVSYGDGEKGEVYSVYLDEKGRLVVY